MRLHTIPISPVRQRGWVGIIVILLALAIVAVLAKDALKSYGLAPGAAAKTKAGSPGERARTPGAIAGEALDPGAAAVTPAGALERAREVEDMVKQMAAEREARPDGPAR